MGKEEGRLMIVGEYVKEFGSLDASGGKRSSDRNHNGGWCPPSQKFVKINLDGAFLNQGVARGFGVVARDYKEAFLGACAGGCSHSSALMMKAIALLQGMKLARRLGMQKMVIESNAKVVLHELARVNGRLLPYDHICDEILLVASDVPEFALSLLIRMVIKVAHALVENGATSRVCQFGFHIILRLSVGASSWML